MSLGIMLRHPSERGDGFEYDRNGQRYGRGDVGGIQFARVKVPQMLPQWVRTSLRPGPRSSTPAHPDAGSARAS
jgi:hypothetical protein